MLTMSFWQGKKILVTGASGFVGTYVVSLLRERGVGELQLVLPKHSETDLRRWEDCQRAVSGVDMVMHLAANVGGIGKNRAQPGTLFYDNLVMGAQLMEAARQAKVSKFVAIGTVCAYPKFTPVPFREDELWNGYPEETNAPYGLAKKMLLVQAQAYRQEYGFNAIYLLPVNLYGPNDNFDLETSHVIPALIRKMAEARASNTPTVEIWGTGKASREFLYVKDAAEGIILAAEKYDGADPVNLGSGREITIKDLAGLIAQYTGYRGELVWNSSQPDGQPRRCLDVSRAKKYFGFTARTNFEEGLRETVEWYEKNRHSLNFSSETSSSL